MPSSKNKKFKPTRKSENLKDECQSNVAITQNKRKTKANGNENTRKPIDSNQQQEALLKLAALAEIAATLSKSTESDETSQSSTKREEANIKQHENEIENYKISPTLNLKNTQFTQDDNSFQLKAQNFKGKIIPATVRRHSSQIANSVKHPQNSHQPKSLTNQVSDTDNRKILSEVPFNFKNTATRSLAISYIIHQFQRAQAENIRQRKEELQNSHDRMFIRKELMQSSKMPSSNYYAQNPGDTNMKFKNMKFKNIAFSSLQNQQMNSNYSNQRFPQATNFFDNAIKAGKEKHHHRHPTQFSNAQAIRANLPNPNNLWKQMSPFVGNKNMYSSYNMLNIKSGAGAPNAAPRTLLELMRSGNLQSGNVDNLTLPNTKGNISTDANRTCNTQIDPTQYKQNLGSYKRAKSVSTKGELKTSTNSVTDDNSETAENDEASVDENLKRKLVDNFDFKSHPESEGISNDKTISSLRSELKKQIKEASLNLRQVNEGLKNTDLESTSVLDVPFQNVGKTDLSDENASNHPENEKTLMIQRRREV